MKHSFKSFVDLLVKFLNTIDFFCYLNVLAVGIFQNFGQIDWCLCKVVLFVVFFYLGYLLMRPLFGNLISLLSSHSCIFWLIFGFSFGILILVGPIKVFKLLEFVSCSKVVFHKVLAHQRLSA